MALAPGEPSHRARHRRVGRQAKLRAKPFAAVAAVDELINAWTRTLTIDQVDALMIEHSIPAGRVYRAPDMLADPHFAARQAIIEVETERYGKLKMQNAFPKLSASPSGVRSPAPSVVGQHNAEIYGQLLCMSEAELDGLKAAGVI